MVVLLEAGDVIIQEDGEVQVITLDCSSVFDTDVGLVSGGYDYIVTDYVDAMSRFEDGRTVLDLSDGEGGLWTK